MTVPSTSIIAEKAKVRNKQQKKQPETFRRNIVIICAVFWLAIVFICFVCCLVALLKIKYGTSLLSKDIQEEFKKDEEAHNGSVTSTSNEVKLCLSMRAEIAFAGSIYTLSWASFFNLYAAFYLLYGLLKKRLDKTLLFQYVIRISFFMIIGAIILFFDASGFSLRELVGFLMVIGTATVLLIPIFSYLRSLESSQKKKMERNIVPITHKSLGGLKHTVSCNPKLENLAV